MGHVKFAILTFFRIEQFVLSIQFSVKSEFSFAKIALLGKWWKISTTILLVFSL